MSAGSVLILAAAIEAGARDACDTEARLARLGRGVCALEAVPGGVRARRCGDEGGSAKPVDPDASATAALLGATADVAVRHGTSIWMGVSEHGACGARPRGLVRLDPARAFTHAFRGTDAGPCGFLVHDLLVRGDTLWVATDLGVSRLRLSPDDWDEWTHYAISADGAALDETACASLLTSVAEAAVRPGGDELGRWLAEFRPRFVRRLPRGLRRPSPAPGRPGGPLPPGPRHRRPPARCCRDRRRTSSR